jgi:hypothetical protein
MIFPPPRTPVPAGVGGGAPTTSSYVVIGLDAGLSADRKLAVDPGLVLTDGGANGNATLGPDFGAIAGKVTQGNDARLSDDRTPTAHAASHNAGGSDALTIDAAAATGSLRTLGTTATKACAGNDARLSDARGGGVSGHTGTTIGAARRYFVAGARGGTALVATVAPSIGNLRAMPFRCPNRSGTIDFVGIYNAVVAVGAQGRLGIYRATSESNIYPSTLIAESGVIDMSATGGVGVKSFNPAASYSPGELLWVTYLCGTLAPTVRGPVVAACDTSFLGYDSALATTPGVGLLVAHAFGALPAPFTAGAAAITTVTIPGIFVGFSA